MSTLRRQSEELKSEVEGLEGLVRRLVEEREVLVRRLEGGERREVVGSNALGLIDSDTTTTDGRHSGNSRSSSMSDSTTSTTSSIATPKTPTTLFHSPLPIEYGRSKPTPRRAASPTLPLPLLPRIKYDALPTSGDLQWNVHH